MESRVMTQQPDATATPSRLLAKAAGIRIRSSRVGLGGGLLFLPNEQPNIRISGNIHAVPDDAAQTLCGLDASHWRPVPGVAWHIGLTQGCSECEAVTRRLSPGEYGPIK
jgi:hypothetical protein